MGGNDLRLMGGDGLPVWLQSSKQQQREQQQQQRVFCALIKVAATVVSVASKMTAKPFAWPGERGTKQLPKSCNDACSSRYCYKIKVQHAALLQKICRTAALVPASNLLACTKEAVVAAVSAA